MTMNEEHYDIIKDALLGHVRDLFEEIEEDLARTHEEKYAMLEDQLNNASDVDELKVAFEQWFNDHAEELELEFEVAELWANALANAEIGL